MATAKATKKTTPKKSVKSTAGEFAVITTGGKQYMVAVGETITIEKMKGEFAKGDTVVFDQVLLLDNGTDTTIGTPYIAGAKVTGEISLIGRAQKVVVLKYKQKSRYQKKNGHRQPFFKITITAIK